MVIEGINMWVSRGKGVNRSGKQQLRCSWGHFGVNVDMAHFENNAFIRKTWQEI